MPSPKTLGSNPLPPTELKSDESLAQDIELLIITNPLARQSDLTALISAHTGQLRQRIAELQEQARLIQFHREADLESDSIVASCDCMTKTNEITFHKPGCKYRLICERDDARQIVRNMDEEKAAMLPVAEAELTQLRDRLALVERERDDAKDYHQACIAEFYRMLGVDISDGEIRFKWAALALAEKLSDLSALRQQAAKDGADRERMIAALGKDTSWPNESLLKALVVAESELRRTGRDFDGWESIQTAANVAQQRIRLDLGSEAQP